MTIRIAVWSGPRNISTALMRSWGSRPDTAVSDEPLYAHYLLVTGAAHPGRDEVLAHHDSDWRRVVKELLGPVPGGKPIWYQKHMAHHLTPDIDREWILGLTNILLIRDPRAMIASYAKVIETPRAEDLGLPQQTELFSWLSRAMGAAPVIIDSADILADPRSMLSALCDRCGVSFSEAMLRWEPGPRPTDGVWAKYWYGNVQQSDSFLPPRDVSVEVPSRLRAICDQCLRLYEPLYAKRLRP